MKPSDFNRRRALARGVVLALIVGMVVVPTTLAQDTNVNISNTAPTVASVSLPLTVNPTAGTTTAVSVTIVVDDLNGYNDISSVTAEVLKPDGSTTHVAAAAATFSSGTATAATYTYSFDMNFYDAPALLTDTYKVKVVVTDQAGATGDNLADLGAFNYAELAAVTFSSSTLDFGSNVAPGDASAIQNLTLQNGGNVVLDSQLSGTDLTNASTGASIPVGNITYSAASNMSGEAALTTSATTLATFDLATGPSSTKDLYWQLTVPTGDSQWIPSGAYTGDLTLAAVKST